MLARRMLLLFAVLLGITMLAAGIAPRRPLPTGGPSATTPAPSRSATAPLERTLSADPGMDRRRVVVSSGRLVRLTVEGDVVDSVAVGDLRIEAIDPGSPALFELLADAPGTYPIRLLQAQRSIGVLEVRDRER